MLYEIKANGFAVDATYIRDLIAADMAYRHQNAVHFEVEEVEDRVPELMAELNLSRQRYDACQSSLAKAYRDLSLALSTARSIIEDNELQDECEAEIKTLVDLGMDGFDREFQFEVEITLKVSGSFTLARNADEDDATDSIAGAIASQFEDFSLSSVEYMDFDNVEALDIDTPYVHDTDWSCDEK